MTNRTNENGDPTRLSPQDARFVERVREVLTAPPLTPERRVAFHANLDAKIERSRRSRFAPRLAVVGAMAAVCILALRLSGGPTQPVALDPGGSHGAVVVSETLVEDSIFAQGVDSGRAEDDALPDDYQAIAGVFLGT